MAHQKNFLTRVCGYIGYQKALTSVDLHPLTYICSLYIRGLTPVDLDPLTYIVDLLERCAVNGGGTLYYGQS